MASRIIKIVITLSLVGLLVFWIDWRDVAGHMRTMDVRWIVAYASAVTLGNVVSSYRWRLLAVVQGSAAPLRRFVSWYLTGTFLNNFFPGFIGGDAYRIYRSATTFPGASRFVATLTVIMDRLTGLYGALLLVAALTVPWWFSVGGVGDGTLFAQDTLPLTVTGGGAVTAAAIASIGIFARHRILSVADRFLPERYRTMVGLLRRYTNAQIIRNTAWSAIFALVGVAVANYVLFLAFGVALPPLAFALLVIAASVVAALPISIGNFGVKEWAYVVLLDGVGVSASLAVTVVLASRAVMAILSLAGAGAYYIDLRTTPAAVSDGEERRWHDALSGRHIMIAAAIAVALIVIIIALR